MKTGIKQRIEQINNGIVPDGYKKTEFGVFPCDWVCNTIGDVSKDKGKYGINAPACEQTGDLPKYLRITDIDEEGKYIDNGAFVDNKDSKDYILKENDIVFARTGASVGKSYLYSKKDGILAYAGFLIKFSIDKDKCNPYIVKSACTTQRYNEWVEIMSARSGQPGINAEEYATYEFIVPKHTEEQEKIAEILMKWDKAIELQEKYIEKLNQQKSYLLKKLFKLKTNWTFSFLGDSVDVLTSGGTPSTKKTEYFDGDIVWVSIDDISQSGKYISKSNRTLSECGLQNSSAKLFPKGTLLYAMYASIGKCAIADTECATSQAILGIVPKENCFDNQYLYYYLCSIQDKISAQGQQGTQANLNKGIVERFKIPTPIKNGSNDIDEQKHISNILITIDDSILFNVKKIENLKQQRKALQQYLLNGIVRV